MQKKYIYMLLIFLFFVISTYIYSVKYTEDLNAKYVYNSDELKCKFNISNIKESNENYEILVYYPVTEYKDINSEIMQEVNSYIDNFKNNLQGNNNKLSITFDNFEKDMYTSFIFNVEIKNDTSHDNVYTFCYNINNENGKIYGIDELIEQGNTTKQLAEYIYDSLKQNKNIQQNCDYEEIKKYLNEDKEKYSNFYFSKEGIVFCFNPDTIVPKVVGIVYALVPNENIKSN